MVYGVIYKISNSINNKIYIGQTKSNPPSCRWNRHKYSVNKGCNVPIHNAMRLYGIEKFTGKRKNHEVSFNEIYDILILFSCTNQIYSFHMSESRCLEKVDQPFFRRHNPLVFILSVLLVSIIRLIIVGKCF
jgi:hypothetical protein